VTLYWMKVLEVGGSAIVIALGTWMCFLLIEWMVNGPTVKNLLLIGVLAIAVILGTAALALLP